MQITIDTVDKTLTCKDGDTSEKLDLFSKKAFEIISHQWLKIGWNEKYPYTFTWFGRPIIQIPEDMIRIQEVIYNLKPSLIIETGVAHGGSLVYYASICKAMGHGRVIGVDIEIRPHNREAIEEHPLFDLITLIEGDSTSPETLNAVKKQTTKEDSVVMVILDSNHLKNHVLAELEAYHELVTKNSYIVATDGSMMFLDDVPRGDKTWKKDNPVAAVNDFINSHKNFVSENPKWAFNESKLSENITHWPAAWLRRIS